MWDVQLFGTVHCESAAIRKRCIAFVQHQMGASVHDFFSMLCLQLPNEVSSSRMAAKIQSHTSLQRSCGVTDLLFLQGLSKRQSPVISTSHLVNSNRLVNALTEKSTSSANTVPA